MYVTFAGMNQLELKESKSVKIVKWRLVVGMKKSKYICEYHDELGIEKYYKQNYLSEFDIWGVKYPITEKTFLKRMLQGYPVKYVEVTVNVELLKEFIVDIDSFINLAIDTSDKEWFMKLAVKRNKLISVIKKEETKQPLPHIL
jgi:hypothetical protein